MEIEHGPWQSPRQTPNAALGRRFVPPALLDKNGTPPSVTRWPPAKPAETPFCRNRRLTFLGGVSAIEDLPHKRSRCECTYGRMHEAIVRKPNQTRRVPRRRLAAPALDARASNAGDRYHLAYAARRALEMLHPSSDLKAVALENVAPKDQNLRRDERTFLAVDLTEYYG